MASVLPHLEFVVLPTLRMGLNVASIVAPFIGPPLSECNETCPGLMPSAMQMS